MIKYTSLRIPEPCHQFDYDAVPSGADHKSCHLCHKKVYDFRNKDEAYFNKLWKEHKGDLCGVFYKGQVGNNESGGFSSVFLKRFKNSLLSMFFGVWTFVSKGQEATVKPNVELSPADSNVQNANRGFKIVSEREGRIDTYAVDIYINKVFFDTYYIGEDTFIRLPDSLKDRDVITIKRKKEVSSYRRGPQYVTKVKRVRFRLGTNKSIVVRVSKKRKLTLHFRDRARLQGKVRSGAYLDF